MLGLSASLVVGFILLVVAFFWLVEKSSSVKTKKTPPTKKDPRSEAKEIASKTMTIKQFRGLERRIERAEEKMGEVESQTAYESIRYRHDVLQKAMNIAENRIYG
jgi:hypothetical protein